MVSTATVSTVVVSPKGGKTRARGAPRFWRIFFPSEKGDRRQGTGDRRQGTGDRGQRSGVRGQEPRRLCGPFPANRSRCLPDHSLLTPSCPLSPVPSSVTPVPSSVSPVPWLPGPLTTAPRPASLSVCSYPRRGQRGMCVCPFGGASDGQTSNENSCDDFARPLGRR
jgi:hypothetical protein